MIEVKLVDVINSVNALKKINENENLSFKTALKLSKISKEINDCLEEYQKRSKQIAEKFGEKNEDGSVKITNVEQFNKEHSKILNDIIEFEYNKIEIDEIEKCENLSPNDILTLEWLLNTE